MAITIKNLNNLTNKMNKIDNLKAKKAVEEVAKVVESNLKNGASKFSKRSDLIRKADVREYENGNYYVDVGLKNDSQPWEDWKHLYFHHYGYNQKLWGKDSDIYTKTHQFWFTNAVDNMDNEVLKELKKKIQAQIKEALK